MLPFPDPLGAIADDAQPHRLLGNQVRVFDLLQGLTYFLFRVHLMPTEDMHDALAIEQVQAKPLGFAPLVAPSRPTGAVPRLPRAVSPRARRTRRDVGPVNPQDQHRTAKTARCDLGHASINLLARRRHLDHAEALGHLVGERVHALTTHGYATEVPETAVRPSHMGPRSPGPRWPAGHPVASAPDPPQHLVERIAPHTAALTI